MPCKIFNASVKLQSSSYFYYIDYQLDTNLNVKLLILNKNFIIYNFALIMNKL